MLLLALIINNILITMNNSTRSPTIHPITPYTSGSDEHDAATLTEWFPISVIYVCIIILLVKQHIYIFTEVTGRSLMVDQQDLGTTFR